MSVGSPNSGTEVIALRLMAAAGLDPDEDISKRGLGVGESAQALRDGSIDAFFWSGGVPTAAVVDVATTDDIRLLPTDAYLSKLRERYGEAYQPAEIEKGAYGGVGATKTIGVPNLLVVNTGMSDALAHDITEVLYDSKEELTAIVPSAKNLDPKTGQKIVTPVKLHPGARRYYRELGAK